MELPPFNFPNPLGLFGGSKQVSICDASDVIKNTNGNRRRSTTATKTIKQRSTGMAKIGYYHWQHFFGTWRFRFFVCDDALAVVEWIERSINLILIASYRHQQCQYHVGCICYPSRSCCHWWRSCVFVSIFITIQRFMFVSFWMSSVLLDCMWFS